MKETKEKLFVAGIIILIFVVVFGLFGMVIFEGEKQKKECYDLFNEEYSFWGNGINYNYRYIDENHFNCCWKETYLELGEGYYKKEKCKGFTRE